MEAADLSVLLACREWQVAQQQGVLVTVVRTWGSSPRPPGSMMAIRSDGAISGSVSGGCIEDDLIATIGKSGIASLCKKWLPATITYGISAEEAHRFGLPCGGTLQLVLEPLDAGSKIDELIALLQQRQPTSRSLDLSTGSVTLTTAMAGSELKFDGNTLINVLGPQYRMIVIGAGQLSRYFSEVATGLGFDVTVCDPREEYRADWDVSGVHITHDMPDDVVLAAQPDERTAIVALTHDPKLDDLALIDALRSPAFYVGALGSRTNHAKRIERLKHHFGLSDRELGRLRGPAGLYIGSKTPSEIALSILAEIISIKNGVMLPEQLTVGMAKDYQRRHVAVGARASNGLFCY